MIVFIIICCLIATALLIWGMWETVKTMLLMWLFHLLFGGIWTLAILLIIYEMSKGVL